MINSELEKLKEWLHGNKLSLNMDKTTSVIVGTKRKLTDENEEICCLTLLLMGNIKIQLNI